jgi:hypothetical protein
VVVLALTLVRTGTISIGATWSDGSGPPTKGIDDNENQNANANQVEDPIHALSRRHAPDQA